MRRALTFALPAIAWAALIFYASSRSDVPGPPIEGGDKVIHFFVYAVLGALSLRALTGYDVDRGFALVAAVLLGALYGASDEIHQTFTPNRTPDIMDWLADLGGVAGGSFTAALWLTTREIARRKR